MVTEKLRNHTKCTCHENEEVEPVQPAEMNTHQSNTCRKDLQNKIQNEIQKIYCTLESQTNLNDLNFLNFVNVTKDSNLTVCNF